MQLAQGITEKLSTDILKRVSAEIQDYIARFLQSKKALLDVSDKLKALNQLKSDDPDIKLLRAKIVETSVLEKKLDEEQNYLAGLMQQTPVPYFVIAKRLPAFITNVTKYTKDVSELQERMKAKTKGVPYVGKLPFKPSMLLMAIPMMLFLMKRRKRK